MISPIKITALPHLFDLVRERPLEAGRVPNYLVFLRAEVRSGNILEPSKHVSHAGEGLLETLDV